VARAMGMGKMYEVTIVGMGRVGSAIANALLLLSKGIHVNCIEPYRPNWKHALGEIYDLLPVAVATGNEFTWDNRVPSNSSIYVITSGKPRQSPKETKENLYWTNMPIVEKIMKDIPKDVPVFIVTNPPNIIAQTLRGNSPLCPRWHAYPLRAVTDDVRAAGATAICMDGKELNNETLRRKGFTQYTPGFACAQYILREIEFQQKATCYEDVAVMMRWNNGRNKAPVRRKDGLKDRKNR